MTTTTISTATAMTDDNATTGTHNNRRRRLLHPQTSSATVVSAPLDCLRGMRLRLASISDDDRGNMVTMTSVKVSRKLGEGGSAFVYLAKEKPSSSKPSLSNSGDGGVGGGGGGRERAPMPRVVVPASSSASSTLGGLLTPRRMKKGRRRRQYHDGDDDVNHVPASPPSLVRARSHFSPLPTPHRRGGDGRRRLVVLKVSSVDTRDGIKRAMAEAGMLRRLSANHPNVVRYHGNGFLSSSGGGAGANCSYDGGGDDDDHLAAEEAVRGSNLGVGGSSADSCGAAAVAAPSPSSTGGGGGGGGGGPSSLLFAFDAATANASPPAAAPHPAPAPAPAVHWLMMEYCGGGSLLDLVVACRRQHVYDANGRRGGNKLGSSSSSMTSRMEEGSGSQPSVSSSKDGGGGPTGLRRVASSLLSPTRGGSSRWGGDNAEERHQKHRYHRRLDVQEVLSIFLHVCSAVSYMHSGGDGDGNGDDYDDDDDICIASDDDDDDDDDGEEGVEETEKDEREDNSPTGDVVGVAAPSEEESSSSTPSPSPSPSPLTSTSAQPRTRRRRRGKRRQGRRQPILHLDIKLENILLVHPPATTSSAIQTPPSSTAGTGQQHHAGATTAMGNYQERWRCKLCDLGSARVGRIPLGTAEERRSADDVVRTTTTQMYRAPEMVDLYNAAGEITEKADVWALGCCLYNVVFLRNCFDPRNSNLAILAGKYDVPPKRSKSSSSSSSSPTADGGHHDAHHPYPDGLIELITDRMLVVDPRRRATVDHVVDCLHALQLGRDLPPGPGLGLSSPSSEAGAVDGGDHSKCVVPSPHSPSSPSRSRLLDASQDKENSPPPRKATLRAPNSVAKRRMLLAKKRSSAAAADPFSTLAASSRSQSLWNADEHDDGDSSSVASSLMSQGGDGDDGLVLFRAEPNGKDVPSRGGGWVNFFSTATCGGSEEVFGKNNGGGLPPLMRTNSNEEDRRMLGPFAQEPGRPLSFRLGGPTVAAAETMGVEAGGSGSFPRLRETPIKVPPPGAMNDGAKDDGVLVTTDESNGSSDRGSIEELTNLFARGDWVEVVEVESDNENRKCVVSPTHDCVEVSAFLPTSSSDDLNEARQRLLFSGSGE